MMRAFLLRFVCFGLAVSLPTVARTEKPAGRTVTAGSFLADHVNVKSRNLLRTSRFLRFNQQYTRIQIAFVLDGTESMTHEFAALRANLAEFATGLSASFGNQKPVIELTAVIYRDTESVSAVQIVSPGFVLPDEFASKFALMDVDSGEPYFQERVDEGLHAAIVDLPWAPPNEESVARWILLCGDAPPYSSNATDYATPEDLVKYRKHTSESLVELALARSVSIYGVLCTSGFQEGHARSPALAAVAESQRPALAKFMATVSKQTGGRYVDTSDTDRLMALVKPDLAIDAEIDPITESNIQQFRAKIAANEGRQVVRVAVLPHMPFASMEFTPNWFPEGVQEPEYRPEVQVATEIRRIMPELGKAGAVMLSPIELKESVELFQGQEFANDNQRMAAIANELRADYIIWGNYRTADGQSSLSTGIYGGIAGNLIVETSTAVPEQDFALQNQPRRTLEKLSRVVEGLQGERRAAIDVDAFSQGANGNPTHAVVTPIARDLRAQRSLLAGLEWLELAMGYLKPDVDRKFNPAQADQTEEYLHNAISEFEATLAREDDNPLAHLLISCSYYNINGIAGTEDDQKKFQSHLAEAYRHREVALMPASKNPKQYLSPPAREEVEAYYALFHQEPEAAIDLFEKISHTGDSIRGHFALRAHWMLAGLYLGDWDAGAIAPSVVDADKARDHILHVLAFWGGSSEAKFYRECLFPTDSVNPEEPVNQLTPPSIQLTETFNPIY